MLNAVIRFALQYRLLIVFLSLVCVVYGSFVMATMPIDVLPDLDRPRVVILTECPGYVTEDVETQITFPLEAAINGATGVSAVRSQSGPSISIIWVDFHWNTNIYTARQIVQERLSSVQLPDGIAPHMAPISSLMGQVMIVGLSQKVGPNGGRLATIDKTGMLAELLVEPAKGQAKLYLWDPRAKSGLRSDESQHWEPLAGASQVRLDWTPEKSPATPDTEQQLTMLPLPGKTNLFAGTSELLKFKNTETPKDITFHVELERNGKQHRITFDSAPQSQMQLRTLADWVVRLRLLKIGGVAQVVSMGGGRKQYQVLINPDALVQHEVTLEQVVESLQKNNVAAGAGWIDKGDREQPVRFLGRLGPGPAETMAQLQKIPVKGTDKRTISLAQVARVVEAPQMKRGDAGVNGKPGVVLMITKQPHTDTRALTQNVLTALDELKPSLPANVEVNPELFQLKRFIDLGVYNVVEALAIGAVLVLVILFFFLLNFRTTFISLTAIPLSLAITAIVFKAVGWFTETQLSINVMTLGGIAVAMGELVDDAIVDVENIFRRLRENSAASEPRSPLAVIYEASIEIRSAIVFGTIMVILVFVPLFFLPGIEGRLFVPLAVAYIVSILSSLLVSLTVTPVLSYMLLVRRGIWPWVALLIAVGLALPLGFWLAPWLLAFVNVAAPLWLSTAISAASAIALWIVILTVDRLGEREKDSPLLRFLKWMASFLIRFSMAHPGLLLFLTWVTVAVSAWMLTQIGTQFLPPFDEGSFQVNISLPAGSSLNASNETTAQADIAFLELRKKGIILDFVKRTGRAELDEHVEPVSNTEYILTINPDAMHNREEVKEAIGKTLEEMQLGANVETEQPLAHLISHMMTGVTAQIAVKIYGDDLVTLKQTAEQVKAAIAGIKDIKPPVVEPQQLTEELHIVPRDEKLLEYNIDKQHLADFVRTAIYGKTVSQVLQQERRFDLVVRLDEPYRNDYQRLSQLKLPVPHTEFKTVNLATLADIGEGLGPNSISRENVRRRIVVRVHPKSGADLGGVVTQIRKRIQQKVRMPEGYFAEIGGQFESQQRAAFVIVVFSILAAMAMFIVLFMLYPSWRIVLQILNALPTAFIGGVLALVITQQKLSVAAMVGFISLGGIAVRNGILLVSHYLHLMKNENESFSKEMILRGSLERLSPVLMTALTAGFALLPLVVAGQEPGREILYPVATVIFGGLITSTFCEFLIHPGLFWHFSGGDAQRLRETS